MWWVSGIVAAWLAATPLLLPVLGRLLRAGRGPTPPADAPLPHPHLRLLPDPTA